MLIHPVKYGAKSAIRMHSLLSTTDVNNEIGPYPDQRMNLYLREYLYLSLSLFIRHRKL